MLAATAAGPPFRRPAATIQLIAHREHALALQVERENLPHGLGFGLIHHQPPASCSDIVPERRASTDPLPFPTRRRHLVSRALANQLPFELRVLHRTAI